MGITVVGENLTCWLQEKKAGWKAILKDVGIGVQEGEVFAVMGPSGSGKTTLLNLLAGRMQNPLRPRNLESGGSDYRKGPATVDRGKGMCVEGSIYYNGEQMSKMGLMRHSRYVMQTDCMLPLLTVRETLYFAAQLKLVGTRKADIESRINSVINELGLESCQDVIIGAGGGMGGTQKGISGGQRKRVSIGIELLDNPELLFLDEPTTGLDSSLAFDVIKILKKLSQNGRTIIATIHQPRSQIFQLFDKLLLLSQGRVVYHGATSEVRAYLTYLKQPCPPSFNVADFLLDLVSYNKTELNETVFRSSEPTDSHHPVPIDPVARLEPTEAEEKLVQPHLQANLQSSQRSTLTPHNELGHRPSRSNSKTEGRIFLTSDELDAIPKLFETSDWGAQWKKVMDEGKTGKGLPQAATGYSLNAVSNWFRGTYILTKREAINLARNPQMMIMSGVVGIIMSLISGAIFFQVPDPQGPTDCMSFFNFLGALAFSCINLSFAAMQTRIDFPLIRPLFNREVTSGLYKPSQFYLASNLNTFFPDLIYPLTHTLTVYWMVGFGETAGDFFYFLLLSILVNWAAASYCTCAVTIAPTPAVASILCPVGIIIPIILSGFWITEDRLPAFWGVVKYISWVRYGINSYVLGRQPLQQTLDDCYNISRKFDRYENLGLVVTVGMIWRLIGFFTLKAFNRRVGMES